MTLRNMTHSTKASRILTSFVANMAGSAVRPASAGASIKRMASSLVGNRIRSTCFSKLTLSSRNANLRPMRGFCGHRDTLTPCVLKPQVVTCFDKIPTKLPAWWDDEDDEDDEEERTLKGEGGDDGSETGGLTNTRFMRAKMAMDGSGSEASGPVVMPGGGAPGGGSGVFNNGGGGSGSGGGRGDGQSGGKGNEGGGDIFGSWYLAPITLYLRLLTRRPLLAKAITASVLGILGDALAQWIARKRNGDSSMTMHEHNWRRTNAIALLGIVFVGPALHVWYGLLNQKVVGRGSLIKKLLWDQLAFSPVLNIFFSIALPTLEGEPFGETVETCKEKIWSVMKASWLLFPPAQLINFSLVPLNLQPVFSNAVGLIWNVLFTYILHDEGDEAVKGMQTKGVTS